MSYEALFNELGKLGEKLRVPTYAEVESAWKDIKPKVSSKLAEISVADLRLLITKFEGCLRVISENPRAYASGYKEVFNEAISLIRSALGAKGA